MRLLKGNIENVTVILFDDVSRITQGLTVGSRSSVVCSEVLLSRKTAEMSPTRCLVRCAQLGLSWWVFELLCGM